MDRLFDMDDEDFEDMKEDQNDEFYFEYLKEGEAGAVEGDELGDQLEGQDDDDEDMVTIKTLIPTHEQLESLNLKPGPNVITFQVNSRLQGCQKITGKIFLWDYRTKIVISDVDGTITRSDVMGHVMPRFGNDWSHHGIADLFTKISGNGYQFIYLTARAIGQAETTRAYIYSLRQEDGGRMLPEAPILMSPDRLMRSFNREVILRKPQVFKIACLKNIVRLFPKEHPPFYCGFGNRDSDAVSYRDVGVPLGKIFIINPDSDIHHFESQQYKKSYPMLAGMIDEMFPCVIDRK